MESQHQNVEKIARLTEIIMLLKKNKKSTRRRRSRIPLKRVDWKTFSEAHMKNNEKDFIKCLRMPLKAFEKLHEILKDDLHKNRRMGAKRGGVIASEIRLYITLRYLGGGSMHDIRRTFGCGKSTAYHIIHEVCHEICQNSKFEMAFPKSESECATAALGFRSISYDDAIVNCVAVLDGYLLHVEQPRKKLVGNQRVFYSGHYKKFGINIQAACDLNSRFIYFALAGPGSQNDKVAIEQCTLGSLIDNLPNGYVAIGDAAYHPTERLAPIFYGVNRDEPLYDNFNFFASQLRIRIEMAFGLMQMKWRFLQQPRQVTRNLPNIVMAIARLHNYVVKFRLDQGASVEDMVQEVQEAGDISYAPSQPSDERGNPMLYNEDGTPRRRPLPKGHSATRHQMAERIRDRNLVRPLSNKKRNEEDNNT